MRNKKKGLPPPTTPCTSDIFPSYSQKNELKAVITGPSLFSNCPESLTWMSTQSQSLSHSLKPFHKFFLVFLDATSFLDSQCTIHFKSTSKYCQKSSNVYCRAVKPAEPATGKPATGSEPVRRFQIGLPVAGSNFYNF